MATGELRREAVAGEEWTAEDFILRGKYCPRPAIYEAVEEARLQAGARAAVVLAADERALLRSLCFQAPMELGGPTDLVGVLRSRDDLNTRADLRALILTSPVAGAQQPPFPWSADRLVVALNAFAESEGEPQVAEWFGPAANWVPARIPEGVRGARISAAAIFLDPSECLARDETGFETVAIDSLIGDITQRINATAQADVRRDAAIMARLDDRLDPSDYVARTVDFRQAATSLVKLAREISGSDVGACYVFDHGTKTMRLVAPDLPGGLDREWRYEDELELTSDALVLTCYSARRPVQLPPGLPTAFSTVLTCGRRDGVEPAEDEAVELATPIVGPLASPKSRAVGVLTVAKLSPPTSSYGAYDLALLRNIALRLSLISATTNSEAAARTFTRLSTRRFAPRSGASLASGQLQTDDSPAPTGGGHAEGPLPDDLVATVPAITEGLATLGRVTGSHSATFRAALPSRETDRAHGVVLRRIAAYPQHWLERDGAIQTAEEGGINWRVVLEGRPYYAPVVASAKGYLSRRPETVAELAVPVFAEGRVIGVVNLESADRNAYDAQVATAQAFAAHVGLAIADARIAIAGVLHDYATEIVRRGHEMGGECKELREAGSQVGGESGRKVHGIADTVERKAKGLRRFDEHVPVGPVGAQTLPRLVEHQVAEVGLHKPHLELNPRDVWLPHAPASAEVIGQALQDILINVKRHSSTHGERPTLELRQGKWGGRSQDLLVVHNWAAEPLDPYRAANAFKAPLVRRLGDHQPEEGVIGIQVPQLGAYLAGTLIRRIGGDAHLSCEPDGRTRVVMSVPVNNPRDTRGRAT